MGKGKTFVKDYEACAKHIHKSYQDNYGDNSIERGTNKTPKKKKRRKTK